MSEDKRDKSATLSALREMVSSPGWLLLMKDLKDKIGEITENILETEEVADKLYTAKEVLRLRRKDLIELHERPVQVIMDLEAILKSAKVEDDYFT